MGSRMQIALLCAAASIAAAGCASSTHQAGGLGVGTEAAFDGRLETVDTSPWAYDGNARLVVDTAAHGDVVVELPARWNLCKASGIGDAGTFLAGQRVRVAGTVTAAGTVTVCEQPQHRIARLP